MTAVGVFNVATIRKIIIRQTACLDINIEHKMCNSNCKTFLTTKKNLIFRFPNRMEYICQNKNLIFVGLNNYF